MGRTALFNDAGEAEANPSRSLHALLSIRELILSGELRAGQRISELSVADLTGISRTPIRAALQRLEQEGFVEPIPSGGYAVKSFSTHEVFDAIEIRGTLEGLAARLAAERGSMIRLGELRECVAELDAIVRGRPNDESFFRYTRANGRFHATVLDMAESAMLKRQVEKAVAHPFASPSGFVMAQALMPESLEILHVAQDQHRCVAEAIAAREGARAQALMQEHARLAARNLTLALKSETAMRRVPGGVLIRRAG